jgi:hypothetical protein
MSNWHSILKEEAEGLINHINFILMKTIMRIAGGLVLSLMAITSKAQTTTTSKPDTVITPVQTQSGWDYKKNPTVDSIEAKYKDKMIANPSAMTMDQVFPVIGKYQSTTNPEAPVITISLDEQNKGIAWIDGLPQGRVKAMLRKSPATYKIPAQTTEEGKEVKEGTLIFDRDANALSIILGKDYNVDDPASVFLPNATTTDQDATAPVVKHKTNKTKIKTKPVEKPWIYTASKITQVSDISTGMNK